MNPSSSTTSVGLPPGPDDALADLLALALSEMTDAWERGERPSAEDLLARYGNLQRDPATAADLIYEEVCLREQHGERVGSETVLRRFPQWRAELAVLLDCRRLFEPDPRPCLPSPGESFGEFHLVAELGRGAVGVVFLAAQPALGDRLLVLKITQRGGSEHIRLARLQHTHIVPLYFFQDDPERHVRILGMPYFGGASLSRCLAALEGRSTDRRTGQDILDVLDGTQGFAPCMASPRGAARAMLANASYIQAVCWIGNCLASALHHAHKHSLIHLDLKPSNVLLTADGQPMLLDFHLAREPLPAGARVADSVGGTPDYMSPEQRAALAAARAGAPIPVTVDARSDIYSLGVLLYEALGGTLPPPSDAARHLRRCNATVSMGLSEILGRAMAPNPDQRYRDMAALATDLQCHARDLLLRGVPNRSWVERWRKWRRRRPSALSVRLLVLGGLAAVLVGVLIHGSSQLAQSRASLAEGNACMHERRFAAATDAYRRGLRAVAHVPFHADLRSVLADQLHQAERARAERERARMVSELHELADHIRLIVGVDGAPLLARNSLEASCVALWERRALLDGMANMQSAPETAPRDDFVDVALFWTDLRLSLAGTAKKTSVRHAVLNDLAEVERRFGSNAGLLHRVELHAEAVGRTEMARQAKARRSALVPHTARDHVELGRVLLAGHRPRDAVKHFDKALALQPDNLWPHFHKGLCAFEMGEHHEAVASFSVCIGLAPKSAQCYCNRGRSYAACGQAERALRDFDRALQLDPALTIAVMERDRLRGR